MEDKTIVCKDCACEFIFPVREQAFYRAKGLRNEPQRCKQCRLARKSLYTGSTAQPCVERYDVTCMECGVRTSVPFRPRENKPVYCQACYRSRAPLP